MHINEAYGELETGNFLLLKEYLGGYNVAGSGSWVAEYYKGPYSDWQNILAAGKTNLIKRVKIAENELFYNYQRLGYMGYPNQLNPINKRYPRPMG